MEIPEILTLAALSFVAIPIRLQVSNVISQEKADHTSWLESTCRDEESDMRFFWELLTARKYQLQAKILFMLQRPQPLTLSEGIHSEIIPQLQQPWALPCQLNGGRAGSRINTQAPRHKIDCTGNVMFHKPQCL